MRLALLPWACVLFLMLPAAVGAWESNPEFSSLTEEEESIFEGPVRLDVEYQSDVLAYTKPEAWQYAWLTHEIALDLSLGSVSATQFNIDNRAKLRAALTRHLEFRWTYFEEGSQEREQTHHMIELVAWSLQFDGGARVGVSFYGEPSLYKRENDTGIALMLKPHARHEVRIFNTFVDVTRLRRNDRNDTHIEPFLPYSRGLIGRIWSNPEEGEGEFLEYAVRYETKTRWLFPDQQYEYGYWRGFASLYGRVRLASGEHLSLRLQRDRKFESRSPTAATSTISDEAWTRDRTFATARATFPGIGPRSDWEAMFGVHFAQRIWDTTRGVARYRDFIPHAELRLPGLATSGGNDRWAIGVDLGWHRAIGESSLFYPQEEPSSVDSRLNLRYDFVFSDRAELRLMVTADLDDFGTRKSWQGGNGQFAIWF